MLFCALLGETANEFCVLHRKLNGLFLGIFEDDAPKQRRCGIIHMNDGFFAARNGVYGPSDQVLPRRRQDLQNIIMGFGVQVREKQDTTWIHTSSGMWFFSMRPRTKL
jgi:hypothetical protein